MPGDAEALVGPGRRQSRHGSRVVGGGEGLHGEIEVVEAGVDGGDPVAEAFEASFQAGLLGLFSEAGFFCETGLLGLFGEAGHFRIVGGAGEVGVAAGVGDDGQHDPKLYTDFAARRPEAVRAIAIRQLSPGEQVLQNGIPVSNDDLAPAHTEDIAAPVLRAPDGYALSRLVGPVVEDDLTDHEAGARALEASDMWGV